jgi:ABC-type lipoprotein release transport system permease subunit
VGLVLEVRNLFLSIKFWIFSWYSVDGSMTIVLPLSAEVTIASFFLSLAVIAFMVFHSMCGLWANLLLL